MSQAQTQLPSQQLPTTYTQTVGPTRFEDLPLSEQREFLTPGCPNETQLINSLQSNSRISSTDKELEDNDSNEQRDLHCRILEEEEDRCFMKERTVQMERQVDKESEQRKRKLVKNDRDCEKITIEVDAIIVRIIKKLFQKQLDNFLERKEGWIEVDDEYAGRINVYVTLDLAQLKINSCLKQIEELVYSFDYLKLQLHEQQIRKLQMSERIREKLEQDKVIMLAGEGKESKCLYLVGRVPKDRLNTIAERLKKLRFVEINVLKYQNKRSYQLLVDKMLSVGVVEQALRDKFKIEYIETLKTMQKTIIIQNTQLNPLVLLLAHSTAKSSTAKQYQFFIRQLLETKLNCITFAFRFLQTGVKYLTKLRVNGVRFEIFHDNKLILSYLSIVCAKEQYGKRVESIINEVEKMGLKIIGVRYLKNVSPLINTYKHDDRAYVQPYPREKPYSWLVKAKGGKQFWWRQHLKDVAILEKAGRFRQT